MLASQWIGIIPDERMLKPDGLGSQLVEDVIDFLINDLDILLYRPEDNIIKQG